MFEIRPSAVLGPFSFDQCCVLLGIMFVLISILSVPAPLVVISTDGRATLRYFRQQSGHQVSYP